MFISDGVKKLESLKKTFSIKVKGLDDKKEFIYKFQPWTRVIELKNKLSKDFGIISSYFRFFYCNIEMIDSMTMLDYQIIDEKSKINLTQRPENILQATR